VLIKPTFSAEFIVSHPCRREMMIRLSEHVRPVAPTMRTTRETEREREREREAGGEYQIVLCVYLGIRDSSYAVRRKWMRYAKKEIYMYTYMHTCDHRQPRGRAMSIHRSCVLPPSACTSRRGKTRSSANKGGEGAREGTLKLARRFFAVFTRVCLCESRTSIVSTSIYDVHSKVDFAPSGTAGRAYVTHVASAAADARPERFLSPT